MCVCFLSQLMNDFNLWWPTTWSNGQSDTSQNKYLVESVNEQKIIVVVVIVIAVSHSMWFNKWFNWPMNDFKDIKTLSTRTINSSLSFQQIERRTRRRRKSWKKTPNPFHLVTCDANAVCDENANEFIFKYYSDLAFLSLSLSFFPSHLPPSAG